MSTSHSNRSGGRVLADTALPALTTLLGLQTMRVLFPLVTYLTVDYYNSESWLQLAAMAASRNG